VPSKYLAHKHDVLISRIYHILFADLSDLADIAVIVLAFVFVRFRYFESIPSYTELVLLANNNSINFILFNNISRFSFLFLLMMFLYLRFQFLLITLITVDIDLYFVSIRVSITVSINIDIRTLV